MPQAFYPPSSPSQRTVMIIAGEASGDAHGAKLVRAMAARDPRISFMGIGGEKMADEGVDIRVDASALSVVGLTEVLAKAGKIFGAVAAARRMLRRQPGLLILIDYPDFNLHVAAYAKKRGIPVLYYISPQIWAWRSGRVHKIGRRIDHMAVILPFEERFYRRHGIPATFVGHPLMDSASGRSAGPAGARGVGYRRRLDSAPVIGLLPGSREGEVARLLPVMLEAAAVLARQHPGMRFLVSRSSSVAPGQLSAILSTVPGGLDIEVVSSGLEDLFQQSTIAVAASGTVTLEAAIAGMPMVVIYRVSPISYRLGRALIRVDHISLVNLIAERPLVPELIQDDASPESIAAAVTALLSNREGLLGMRAALRDLGKRLGSSGASDRTARIALDLLRSGPGSSSS